MKRTALFLASLALVACESETADPSEARVAELDSDEEFEDLEAEGEEHHRKRGERGEHHRSHDGPSTEICEAIACTDAQQAQVKTIFARPEREERPERPDMSTANAALSEAFAGADFSAADLQAWSAQMPARPDHRSHRFDAMSELHTILTPEQRATLADKITAGEVFGGHKERGRKHDRSEDGEHESRRVEHFCEPLQCSDDQQAQLAEVFAQTHDARPDPQAKRDAIAAAFRSDTFDADALRDSDPHDPAAKGEALVKVHAILTAQQRGIVAERIAEHGPRALMGRGGKHRGKGKRRGRRGKRDGGKEFG